MKNYNQRRQQKEQENLVLPQTFTYQFFQSNRYAISENGNYQALCNNGFIKLYTKHCRVYWHTQNEFSHQVHDWKFHVSVKHVDLKKAWNLLAALLLKMECRSGMKVIYLKQSEEPQQGREITIYLIKYDKIFEKSQFAGDFGLSIAVQHSEAYWLQFCKKVEQYLASYGIQTNGLADGDYQLGKYISFRNEAFVRNDKNESIYPPNNCGWNPLKYEIPINLQKFKEIAFKSNEQEQKIMKNWKYRPFLIGIALILTVGLLALKSRLKK